MKLAWVEDRQIVRVSSESISIPKPKNLGQVEVGGVVVPNWYGTIALATSVAGAYHGYKRGRKHPVWNAIGWGFLGSFFWPVVLPVMIAQGFGKPK